MNNTKDVTQILLKVLNEHKLFTPKNLYQEFCTTEKVGEFLKLKYFVKFKTAEDAIESAICAFQSKINPYLREILKSHIAEEGAETLAVLDAELGNAIGSELNIRCESNSAIVELSRCIKCYMDIVLGELAKDLRSMRSEVAHGLMLYKLNSKSMEY